jgi:hypothetical protein
MDQMVKRVFITCVLAMFSISAHAQTKVVVIPMFGDDAAAKWRGVWASGTEYKKGDLVHDLGSSYIATSDHTSDDSNDPQDTFTAWDLVAEKGANGIGGAPGSPGSPGAPGTPGAAATVTVGTTTTGAAGSSASVSNSGTSSAAIFDLTIPKGDKGDPGAKGDAAVGGVDYAQGANFVLGDPGLVDTIVTTIVVNAPSSGHVIVTASAGLDISADAAAKCGISTDATIPGNLIVQLPGVSLAFVNFAQTKGFPVSVGNNTFNFVCRMDTLDGTTVNVWDPSLTAIFSGSKL